MCIPDLALICEIMLMAEGFQQSKVRDNSRKPWSTVVQFTLYFIHSALTTMRTN